MEPLMICLMALRSAQVQGRLMRVQSFRPRKVVSAQSLSSDLSYDCQVCSDAVVDESQEWEKLKKQYITVVVFLQCKSWSFVHWLTGFFGGKIQWIRKYKFRGRSACLYSHCLCFGICPVIAKFARMRWSADPKKQGSGKSIVCWWLWFFNVILSDFSYYFRIHSDAVVDESQTSLSACVR